MSDTFNPYHRWLGIPSDECPPNHYRLLGLQAFESDPDVIEHAADRQMSHLRRLNLSQHGKLAEQLAGEVAAARGCLLNQTSKSRYDAELASAAKAPAVMQPSQARPLMPVARPLNEPVLASQPAAARLSPGPTAQPAARSHATRSRLPYGIAAVVAGSVTVFALIAAGSLLFSQRNAPNAIDARAKPPQIATELSESSVPESSPAPTPSKTDLATSGEPVPAGGEIFGESSSSTGNEAASAAPAPKAESVAEFVPQANSISEPTVSAPISSIEQTPNVPEPPATTLPADSRLPVPAGAALETAEREVREVFAEQLASVSSPEDRLKLVDDLEAQGQDPNNAPEIRYAALRLGTSISTDAGDVDRALESVDLLGQRFAVAVPAEKIALLQTFAGSKQGDVRASALAAAQREFERLANTDEYDQTLALGRVALDLAKATRDKDAIEQIVALGREVRGRQEMFGKFQVAIQELRADPANSAAHDVVGRWHWFVKGDIAQGLQHLAAGSNEELASAASADLSPPSSAGKKLELADQWLRLAEKESPETRQSLLARAEFWYAAAAPDLVGLDKVRADKQQAEIARQLRPPATAESENNAVAASAAGRSKREWKPPSKNSTASFRTFLGVYMYWLDRKKVYPVVNLEVPNANLWTQEIQDKVRGRIPFDEISYVGTAKIAVPADGVYVLEADRAKVTINGLDTGGSGDINIRKGVHVVTLEVNSHGGPYIEQVRLSLRHKETGEEVPFFNTWQDIQRFLGTPIAGQRALDVSDWQPTEEGEIKLDSKTLKVTPN